MKDQKILHLINKEKTRQREYVELIASENYVSADVLEAVGSILTNKYAEGYPNARYYGGCEFIDQIEQLAIDRLKKIFNAKFANVQSHSGSQANQGAYMALLNPGDKIMGMSLTSGGHLTHGFKVSSSGQFYQAQAYEVDPKTHELNYETILAQALKFKPKLIICGASAYSRIIDWGEFRKIADKVGAYLLADVAHIAGLIVADQHPNPLDFGVDVVTSTTHKTLRGPRGGIILTNNEELAKKIDKAVFPGIQGGPLEHVIAAKAIAFGEADTKEFNQYIENVCLNAGAFANEFINLGAKVITNGTDNHLFLVDVKTSYDITGQRAEDLLLRANIVVNKNTIPFDKLSPSIASGVRFGTPAMTTMGWNQDDFIKLTVIIDKIFKTNDNKFADLQKGQVKEIGKKYHE
ncbi:MAG: aminotransferase class I/II-fold pyridoxal phosphate-dependent enzyme [Mycoplasmataceae bacterium]|nr:aminotransferase class I/II-fold pyridoxal phosphate-dependent enzyme [Mycoplasmataceae bacterium]